MSCSNCARSFGLVTREKECANCGFGFCSNCLHQKAKVKVKGGIEKETSVCKKCYKSINEPSSSPVRPRTPPLALQRRLEQLPSPSNAITVYKDSQKMRNLKKGLSPEDQKIADRLELLHKERKLSEKVANDSEITARLAKLKGISEHSDENKPYQAQKSQPEVKQSEDLLSRIEKEVELDKKIQKDDTDEIEQRLAKLKGESKLPKQKSFEEDDDEVGSDEEADKLVEKVMKEQELEKKTKKLYTLEDLEKEAYDDNAPPPIDKGMLNLVRQLTKELKESEELPWCTICNEDANLRCKDCEEDNLYCRRCFKECHEEFDQMGHKTEPYTAKSQD